MQQADGAQGPQQRAPNAAQMFVPGRGGQPPISSGPAPMQSYQLPPHEQPTQVALPAGVARGMPPQPLHAMPATAPPYLASQTAARGGHPIEPWNRSLRTMMILWGAVTIAAFVTPVSIDPLTFNWDAIIHGVGKAKLPMLLVASIGLLSVVTGAITTSPLAVGLVKPCSTLP